MEAKQRKKIFVLSARGSLPLHNLASDSTHLRYVLDPLDSKLKEGNWCVIS